MLPSNRMAIPIKQIMPSHGVASRRRYMPLPCPTFSPSRISRCEAVALDYEGGKGYCKFSFIVLIDSWDFDLQCERWKWIFFFYLWIRPVFFLPSLRFGDWLACYTIRFPSLIIYLCFVEWCWNIWELWIIRCFFLEWLVSMKLNSKLEATN